MSDTYNNEYVDMCVANHRMSCEDWREGNPTKYWTDENGVLCVEYESGKWWHYRKTNNNIEWW